jgi:hypothetical protein
MMEIFMEHAECWEKKKKYSIVLTIIPCKYNLFVKAYDSTVL